MAYRTAASLAWPGSSAHSTRPRSPSGQGTTRLRKVGRRRKGISVTDNTHLTFSICLRHIGAEHTEMVRFGIWRPLLHSRCRPFLQTK